MPEVGVDALGHQDVCILVLVLNNVVEIRACLHHCHAPNELSDDHQRQPDHNCQWMRAPYLVAREECRDDNLQHCDDVRHGVRSAIVEEQEARRTARGRVVRCCRPVLQEVEDAEAYGEGRQAPPGGLRREHQPGRGAQAEGEGRAQKEGLQAYERKVATAAWEEGWVVGDGVGIAGGERGWVIVVVVVRSADHGVVVLEALGYWDVAVGGERDCRRLLDVPVGIDGGAGSRESSHDDRF